MRNQWEYKCVNAYCLEEGKLNELGREGWELVVVYKEANTGSPKAIFKREASQEST